mgnify:CR=1 FL=1
MPALDPAVGGGIIGVACLFNQQEKLDLFDAMLMIGAIIGVPLGLPVLLGLWFKRIYWVTYFVILGVALAPSIYFTYDQAQNGTVWTIQDRMLWLYVAGFVGLLISFPLWRFAKQSERERIDRFFTKMHTPVDFEKEVGAANDGAQLKLIGVSALSMAVLILLLMVLPNSWDSRIQIMCLSLFIAVIGATMLVTAKRQSKVSKVRQRVLEDDSIDLKPEAVRGTE